VKSKYIDGLIGYAIGDAMGLPLENRKREDLLKKPVTKMLDNEVYDLPAGTWGDNTSFLIATIDSINAKNTVDINDIILKFSAFKNHHQFTATHETFKINHTCSNAIDKFEEKNEDITEFGSFDATDNGALIRILPISYYALEKKLKDFEVLNLVKEVGAITHLHEVSLMGCYIYTRLAMFLLTGKDKYSAYSMTKCVDYTMFSEETQDKYKRVLKDDLNKLKINDINSTSDVVDTLEASLWVFLQSENFKEAVIGAINLGNDTSAIGALTAGLAGILYGYDFIPNDWLELIQRKEYLLDIFEEFSENKYE